MVTKLSGTEADTSTDAELLFGNEAGPLVILQTFSESITVE